MPSNMMAIDSNFPTFTGEEPVEVQIRELVNYLYQLRESLQYSLQNLSKENFNITALDQLTEESQKQLMEQLTKIANELSQLSNEVETLKGRISNVDALSSRVKRNEDDIDALEGDVAAFQAWSAYQEETVGDLKNRADGVEQELADQKTKAEDMQEQITDIRSLMDSVDADVAELQGAVQVAEDGSATVGAEGKALRIVGKIYINGVLFE